MTTGKNCNELMICIHTLSQQESINPPNSDFFAYINPHILYHRLLDHFCVQSVASFFLLLGGCIIVSLKYKKLSNM